MRAAERDEMRRYVYRHRYRQRKERGLCVGCGNTPPEGLVVCLECRERIAKYQRNNSERLRPSKIKSSRKTYAKMKAAGLCVTCHKAPVGHRLRNGEIHTFVRCLDCHTAHLKRGRENTRKRKAEAEAVN